MTAADQTRLADAPRSAIAVQKPGVATAGFSPRALIASFSPVAAAVIALIVDRFIPNREHPAVSQLYLIVLIVFGSLMLLAFAAQWSLRPMRNWIVAKGPILA